MSSLSCDPSAAATPIQTNRHKCGRTKHVAEYDGRINVCDITGIGMNIRGEVSSPGSNESDMLFPVPPQYVPNRDGVDRNDSASTDFSVTTTATTTTTSAAVNCRIDRGNNNESPDYLLSCSPSMFALSADHNFYSPYTGNADNDSDNNNNNNNNNNNAGHTFLRDDQSFQALLMPQGFGRLRRVCSMTTTATSVTDSNRSVASYGSLDTLNRQNIRFQVVVWYVGRPDEVLGKVHMKFRVTLYWNAPEEYDPELGYGRSSRFNRKVWTMHGRQRAYQKELKEVAGDNGIVYVPPVSILNAGDFEVVGDPEVCLVNSEENLMKWTCLYKASLLQDNICVANFPHDQHDLEIKLGILKHRQPRKRWDRRFWKLDLATGEDTLDSIQTPHGTIVEHCKVPGFSCDERGLRFEFAPLEFGTKGHERDQQLEIKLRVYRESAYYDRNIIPLLAALNYVAICTLALDAMQFGNRGEMILATAFVEIGIRMTVDSKLPVVGYQIKMQYVLNNFFFGLLLLVVASSLSYVLDSYYGSQYSDIVDQVAALTEAVHLIAVLSIYYRGSNSWWARILCMASVFEPTYDEANRDGAGKSDANAGNGGVGAEDVSFGRRVHEGWGSST